jgi:hypothetical protein
MKLFNFVCERRLKEFVTKIQIKLKKNPFVKKKFEGKKLVFPAEEVLSSCSFNKLFSLESPSLSAT